MWIAILTVVGISAVLGLTLGLAARRFAVQGDPIADRIDALLPQTQCGQCGFAGCRPYAEAIAAGQVELNRCAPGGEATVLALAELLGRDPVALADAEAAAKPKSLAVIREGECIGCTLCLQACPVDAILGAAKQMHTVIADECTGCGLCLPPCPVECIDMVPLAIAPAQWKWPLPDNPERAAINPAPALPRSGQGTA
jgi:electron transport complex protein RnfB